LEKALRAAVLLSKELATPSAGQILAKNPPKSARGVRISSEGGRDAEKSYRAHPENSDMRKIFISI
jgi:hypothetical protein